MKKPIRFFYHPEEEPKAVSVIGDFNDWNVDANPMTRQPDGAWAADIDLPHGHHHYLFCVDGERVLDKRAQGIARDENNHRVSLMSVS